ncbi:hypothetical protein HU200_005867 [Digitaria exilis]|uniref:Uncharacterized protein n=1 Tax=Digitaria exilis TaxID=1010633 RepID=A0A835FS17_9POAL|nr:hypothetical protein HU200_005867 [Digitaria exilis]
MGNTDALPDAILELVFLSLDSLLDGGASLPAMPSAPSTADDRPSSRPPPLSSTPATSDFSLDFLPGNATTYWRVKDSHESLLLLYRKDHMIGHWDLIVCEPMTRRLEVIPRLKPSICYWNNIAILLDSDDDDTDSNKGGSGSSVISMSSFRVLLCLHDEVGCIHACMFTSGSSSWRETSINMPPKLFDEPPANLHQWKCRLDLPRHICKITDDTGDTIFVNKVQPKPTSPGHDYGRSSPIPQHRSLRGLGIVPPPPASLTQTPLMQTCILSLRRVSPRHKEQQPHQPSRSYVVVADAVPVATSLSAMHHGMFTLQVNNPLSINGRPSNELLHLDHVNNLTSSLLTRVIRHVHHDQTPSTTSAPPLCKQPCHLSARHLRRPLTQSTWLVDRQTFHATAHSTGLPVQNQHAGFSNRTKLHIDSVTRRTSHPNHDFLCCTNFNDDTARNLAAAGANADPRDNSHSHAPASADPHCTNFTLHDVSGSVDWIYQDTYARSQTTPETQWHDYVCSSPIPQHRSLQGLGIPVAMSSWLQQQPSPHIYEEARLYAFGFARGRRYWHDRKKTVVTLDQSALKFSSFVLPDDREWGRLIEKVALTIGHDGEVRIFVDGKHNIMKIFAMQKGGGDEYAEEWVLEKTIQVSAAMLGLPQLQLYYLTWQQHEHTGMVGIRVPGADTMRFYLDMETMMVERMPWLDVDYRKAYPYEFPMY